MILKKDPVSYAFVYIGINTAIGLVIAALPACTGGACRYFDLEITSSETTLRPNGNN
jgi:hypothetical protein